MRNRRILRHELTNRYRPSLTWMTAHRIRMSCLFFLCLIAVSIPISGCSHFNEGHRAKATLEEANELFGKGSYNASLDKYQQIIESYPAKTDRVLFEMGIIYAYPKNEQKDYQKSLECFQKLIKDFPQSEYRQNSETLIFNISNFALKDKTIATQQTQIDALQHELERKNTEIVALQKQIEALEQKMFTFAVQKGRIDKILVEKQARRLMLISKGEVIKTYKIALGGNPVGPKERQGDNKTPEGTYLIDSRNKGSRYHLSLHISYPNEKDKKRAKELGVSPGGNIMIHGIKNGFSWVGDSHTEVDWTKGCIAVTDEEIEEISRLAPNGTVVEIRP